MTTGVEATPRNNSKLRTAKDEPVPCPQALQYLKDGNRRFLDGLTTRVPASASSEDWRDMVHAGQSPFAAVMACADSRCPVEIVFDANPGDIFVCRNAGNTCTHAEGSMVGSLEFCVGALRTQLILVLGHTQCGALKGATKAWSESSHDGPKTALDTLLQGLIGVADSAARDLGPGARQEDVASHAVKINVIQTVEYLLKYSQPIRDAVRAGTLQVHGAVYHIETGEVEFMGPSPRQYMLLQSQEIMPPILLERSASGSPVGSARADSPLGAVRSVQAMPQVSYTVAAASTTTPVAAPIAYPTYSTAPVLAAPRGGLTSQTTVQAAPLYSVSNLASYPVTYGSHTLPQSYTTSTFQSSALVPPMTGSHYVTAGTPTTVYRLA